MTREGISLYDTTLRVPLILRLPGVSARDRSIPEQVRLQDVAPTVLDLLRLAAPEERTKLDFLVLLTVQTMNYLHSGRHRVAL